MIEVPIPKDVLKVKTTLVGPFTTRQIVCGAIAVGMDYIAYSIISALKIKIPLDTLVALLTIFAVPALSFAIVSPYGMPLEKYLKNAFIISSLAPKVRPYKIDNFYASYEDKKPEKKSRKFSASELRKHPDYIMYQ